MDDHDHLHAFKDTIPDFGANPTVTSRQSGEWDDPNTWIEGIPGEGDVVRIASGHDVSYSIVADAEIKSIGVEGKLRFSTLLRTRLKVVNLLVYEGGSLYLGDAQNPIQDLAEIVIVDQAPDTGSLFVVGTDPKAYGTGLIAFGEVVMHGAKKTPWVRLAQEPRAGDNILVLESAPQGWNPGDRLLLPDTKQYPLAYQTSTLPPKPLTLQIEEVFIESIDGTRVILSAPLLYDHLAGRTTDGAIIALPHIGNLTRNCIIRSENPLGARGHTMYLERGKVNISYTGFHSLGRTTAAPLSPSNQIGRYPVHFHHLMGPINPTNTGYQFAFVGNVVSDCRKWGIGIHDSHFGLVTDNVVYDAQGSAIMCEQGNERENEIDRNLCVKIGTLVNVQFNPMYGGVRTSSVGGTFGDFGWEGSALWFNGNDNYVRDNVAANCGYFGINYNARSPSGFAHHHPLVPKVRGADWRDPAQWDNYKTPYRGAPPIRECARNEVYASTGGTWVSFSGMVGTMSDLLHWNIRQQGIYAQRNTVVRFERLRVYSNQAVANTHPMISPVSISKGADLGSCTYTLQRVELVDSHIEGFNLGVMLPANIKPNGSTLWPGVVGGAFLTNVVLRNAVNLKDYVTHPGRYTLVNVEQIINPAPVNKFLVADMRCGTV